MIFGRNRIEEDLEKIRNANLPNHPKEYTHDDLKLEKGDLLAMTLAIMSLVLPYIIAFIAIMGIVVFLMGYFY